MGEGNRGCCEPSALAQADDEEYDDGEDGYAYNGTSCSDTVYCRIGETTTTTAIRSRVAVNGRVCGGGGLYGSLCDRSNETEWICGLRCQRAADGSNVIVVQEFHAVKRSGGTVAVVEVRSTRESIGTAVRVKGVTVAGSRVSTRRGLKRT